MNKQKMSTMLDFHCFNPMKNPEALFASNNDLFFVKHILLTALMTVGSRYVAINKTVNNTNDKGEPLEFSISGKVTCNRTFSEKYEIIKRTTCLSSFNKCLTFTITLLITTPQHDFVRMDVP